MSYQIAPEGRTGQILYLINEERARQEELKLEGKFPFTCADNGLTYAQKLSVIMEEIGEVSRELNDGFTESYPLENFTTERIQKIKQELIQVAACCVAWLESL